MKEKYQATTELVPRSSHVTEGSEELGLDRENRMAAKSVSLEKKKRQSTFRQAFPIDCSKDVASARSLLS